MFKDNNTIEKPIVQQGSYRPLGDVIVTRQGKKYCEVVKVAKKTGIGIKKISKEKYVVVATGEVKEFQKNDIKTSDSLKNTFNKLRLLIRHNFDSESQTQLFITLTYGENMTDATRLYTDFKSFYKRLMRAYPKCNFEYISVAEPQGRGAWHLHLMLKDTANTVLYIDNKDLSRIWGHGYTDTARLKSDDVGAYYVAYFTDVLQETGTSTKARQKGARLPFYPVGFNFYRKTRGIVMPEKTEENIEDIVLEFGKAVFEQSYDIKVGDEVVNAIYKATFKK